MVVISAIKKAMQKGPARVGNGVANQLPLVGRYSEKAGEMVGKVPYLRPLLGGSAAGMSILGLVTLYLLWQWVPLIWSMI
jgi:hypothetical protein